MTTRARNAFEVLKGGSVRQLPVWIERGIFMPDDRILFWERDLNRKKYFIEFEFETSVGNRYWLPIFICAESVNRAEEIVTNVETGLNSRWHVTRKTKMRTVIEGLNSSFIEDYIKEGIREGRLAILQVNYWELEALEPRRGLSFDQHIEIVDRSPESFSGKTLATSERLELPVSCIIESLESRQELLVIDVVKPIT